MSHFSMWNVLALLSRRSRRVTPERYSFAQKGQTFSFGGDIVDWPDMSVRQLRALFEQYMAVFNRFEQLPLPAVAAVQGLWFGEAWSWQSAPT
jgi:hypothetical protein